MQNDDILLGRMDGDLACTATQTGFGCQHRCTGHAVAAGYEQGVAHGSFVRERFAFHQSVADVALFKHGVVSVNLLDALLAQSDVKNLQLANERLVLSKEHTEFRVLQRQGHRGAYDVRPHVVGVVLTHQS